MRAVKELGIPLKKNVRLIVGTDEECGSSDIEHYYKIEKEAPMTFSPDAEFPGKQPRKRVVAAFRVGRVGVDALGRDLYKASFLNKGKADPGGLTLHNDSMKPPHHVDGNGVFVQTLLKAYENYTGRKGLPGGPRGR